MEVLIWINKLKNYSLLGIIRNLKTINEKRNYVYFKYKDNSEIIFKKVLLIYINIINKFVIKLKYHSSQVLLKSYQFFKL